jgi:hypothetical protein
MSKTPGTLIDSELSMLACLLSTRVLPCGDRVTTEIALEEHAKSLTEDRRLPAEKLTILDEVSEMTGRYIQKRIRHSVLESRSAHISISNSGCYEYSRSQGGRRAFVLEHLYAWLKEEPSSSRTTILPTGESVIELEGVPRFKTVYPPGYPSPDDSFQRKYSSGLLTEDFKFQEQERTGFQLFAWSFFELRQGGYCDEYGYPTGKPMPITRDTVEEPGIKCRVVTKSLAAFITYGQAFGHVFKELLAEDETLSAGLSAGAQGFEWLKRVGQFQTVVPKYIMVGDFKSATDHVNHEAGRVAMHALARGMGITSGYIHGYIDLLLGPRIFEDQDGIVHISNTASLMGEPGTKSVLTALGKIANVYAHNGLESKLFATAGDDQIDAGNDAEPLLRYAEASELTTMIPSRDKWGVFKYFVRYCQQCLKPNSSVETCEIAIPKVRLLSPETKQGKGDQDTNPAYGKARMFAKEAAWCGDPQLVARMTLMFLRNMQRYIRNSHELFTPIEWGGLGLPGPTMESIWDRIPGWKKCAITQREGGCALTKRLLARWSSARNFERGIVLEEENAFEAYYHLLEGYCVTDVRPLVDLPGRPRYRDVVSAARKIGYRPLTESVNLVLSSQRFQSFWDPTKPTSRGFGTVPWKLRNQRMALAFGKIQSVLVPPISPPGGGQPSWAPELFLDNSMLCTLIEENPEGSEEGELVENQLPLIGPALDGPRVFLHQENRRLIRTTDRSQQHMVNHSRS